MSLSLTPALIPEEYSHHRVETDVTCPLAHNLLFSLMIFRQGEFSLFPNPFLNSFLAPSICDNA